MSLAKEYKLLYNESLLIENMSSMYERCTEDDVEQGKGWYESANSFSLYLTKMYGITAIQSSGIISAFSPLKTWEQNKSIAEEFLSRGICKHTSVQEKKAKLILTDEDVSLLETESILGGLKTINFCNNIYNPSSREHVTIDRHHLYICSGKDLQTCTNNQYSSVKKATISLANKMNMIPSEFQAILWVGWRRLKKENYES